MSETLFILGREPELSVAELEAMTTAWSAAVTVASTSVALVRHEGGLPDRALDRLGGSVKQVTVLERWPITTNLVTTLIEKLSGDWVQKLFPDRGRIEFGLSVYGASNSERAAVNRQGLRLKKELVHSGRPVRYVTSREPQLSAVTVKKNGLLEKGKELVFVKTAPEVIVGLTAAVQDYEAYGRRDFGRPAANPKSGMVPPKLAQMMLNIAGVQPNDVLLDPWCGSGTILQEAALMGVKEIYGSDLEPKAVKSAQENIRWLFKEFPHLRADVEITMRDARQGSIAADVIVTEPDLGKPLRGHEPQPWLHQQAKKLQIMYWQCFEQWKKKLRPRGRVVMIWPEFVVGGADVTIDIEQAVRNLGFRQEPLLSSASARTMNVANPSVLVYARDDAKVRRQIRKWTLR
ncbi:MAG: 50S ribosomal protein L11 methyltransferase [Patescibacteria group bacterium]